MHYRRYVALGDSFTEGVGDPDPTRPNGVRGWADRVAAALAQRDPDLTYANLAIRGRKMRPILTEQIAPAVALRPDLVTIYAGGNDVLRPSVDIDGLMAAYDAAIATLVAQDARVVMFTAFDPGPGSTFSVMRGRIALYSEFVREIADAHGATLIDFWRMREYRDDRLWDVDRLHMSSAGHQQMAINVLNTLGIEHGLQALPLAPKPAMSGRERRAANFTWAKDHVAPWVGRRLRGTSSGDTLSPRFPTLTTPL